jgi:hypothetical protein
VWAYCQHLIYIPSQQAVRWTLQVWPTKLYRLCLMRPFPFLEVEHMPGSPERYGSR